ncbi:CopG family ribbon-helix-helix protein [Noviherbaspirillum pedocola]|uniref:CopG family transcriptional regulator n=1 Tax=Noviherbaspirillum pedocola TaxID=2801341 RepID=A0A934W7V7_9BURK|nr:CopG family transcriptional regulator [Noviherbaspirillum pedocola]MBK4735099.1 CopG family transcriptional regulator [Noviherbaspirillum pedocola]
MSPTTTLRIPEELKSRIAKVAEKAGKSPHTFMLEAIAEKTEFEESRQAFMEQADVRLANMLATGESIPWSEMRAYLQKRMDGQAAIAPKPRKLRD